MKILLIGPLPDIKRKETIGGATVLFLEMVSFLKNQTELPYLVIETNRFRSRIFSFIYVITKVLYNLRKTDTIFLNANSFGVKILWPILFFLAKISKKGIILRVFGSHFDTDIKEFFFKKKLNTLLSNTDVLILETKSLVSTISQYNKNVVWLPNVRQSLDNSQFGHSKKKRYQKKFVYLGHIKKSKGISELLAAFEYLPSEYELSIYGDIQDGIYDFLRNSPMYKGIIDSGNVDYILNNQCVLILPTYYEGEGYPGVIIEAYRAGLPVITTNWKSIPEIVENGITGILIEPRSVRALVAAIQFFDDNNYLGFSQNAYQAFEKFESKKVHENLFKVVYNLNTDKCI